MMICHNKILLDGSNLPVSVSKFNIDTTKNPWYRIGFKKLVSPISTPRKSIVKGKGFEKPELHNCYI